MIKSVDVEADPGSPCWERTRRCGSTGGHSLLPGGSSSAARSAFSGSGQSCVGARESLFKQRRQGGRREEKYDKRIKREKWETGGVQEEKKTLARVAGRSSNALPGSAGTADGAATRTGVV